MPKACKCKDCGDPMLAFATTQNRCADCLLKRQRAKTPKPRKAIRQRGKRTIRYEQWRDEVAKPYLDRTFGHLCVACGKGDYGMHILDVDHKKNRGSHPELIRDLDNVQYLGRIPCHQLKTEGKLKI